MSSSTTTTTALGLGGRVAGDLHLTHNAVLAGEITGSVHSSAHLELSADAVVRGDVHAVSITVAGLIEGDVFTQKTTELLQGGVIRGRLETGQLVAAEGASYEGHLRLQQPKAEAKTRAADESAARPSFRLNRTAPRRQVRPDEVAEEQRVEASFNPIPGAVDAGLRPRPRRTGPDAAAS